MAQPRTKAQLLTATEKERDALQVLLSRLSPEDMVRPGAYGWSAKDHVAHLSEWERMLFGWYEAGWRGEEPAVPAEGYTWASMDALNQRLFERHRDDPPAHVLADWQQTARQLQLLAEQVSEADLFTPNRFAWTGRGTLASFFFECGANHYRWSTEQIRRGLKARP
jgi:hypothetical protein